MSRDPRSVRTESVALATSGLGLALLVVLVLDLARYVEVTPREWVALVAGTAGVQAAVLAAVRSQWSERLRWDPHFVFIPSGAAAILLSAYVLVAPEARMLVMVAWPIVLHFLAGLVGFAGVVALGTLMTLGYLAATALVSSQLPQSTLLYDLTVAGVFLLINLYAGVIHERLRRQRLEFNQLRRRLADTASTDPLTSLPNRRHLEQAILPQLARLARQGDTYSVSMIDIDFFKNYNDTLGHRAGDDVLREFAAVLRGQLRASDVLVRYGGEEFALIMLESGKQEAHTVLDRLRRVIAAHPFPLAEVQPGRAITLSAGVASCPDDGTDVSHLMEQADAALYRAKREGRNRVVATTAPEAPLTPT